MTLADLTDEALSAEWQGRNTVLSIVYAAPARDHIPAVVIESLIDWAKEPMTESEARNARLLGVIRRVEGERDPVPEDLAERMVAAVRAELTGGGQS